MQSGSAANIISRATRAGGDDSTIRKGERAMFTGKAVGDTIKNGNGIEEIVYISEGGSIVTKMADGWYAKYDCHLSFFADEFFSNWEMVAARFHIS